MDKQQVKAVLLKNILQGISYSIQGYDESPVLPQNNYFLDRPLIPFRLKECTIISFIADLTKFLVSDSVNEQIDPFSKSCL